VTAPATTAPVWLETAEVAAHARRHVVSIRRAAASGLLHSHQGIQRGRRQYHIDAVDAWIQGGNERAQEAACGCVHLRAVKRRGAA
jgi:hypothetical protein